MAAVFTQTASDLYHSISSELSDLYFKAKEVVFIAGTSKHFAVAIPRQMVISYGLAVACGAGSPLGVAAFIPIAYLTDKIIREKSLLFTGAVTLVAGVGMSIVKIVWQVDLYSAFFDRGMGAAMGVNPMVHAVGFLLCVSLIDQAVEKAFKGTLWADTKSFFWS